ncbi:MAG: thioredoxin fold domain-containing protein [Cocleimonas sp.]
MKFLISCLVLLTVSILSASDNIESALLEESDFKTLSLTMEKESLGLVLMLHAEHCPYCALMESDILSPMVKSKEYDKKVLIRKLQIDEARDIIDFAGETVEPSDLSDQYQAPLTPTLVFLDYKGNEKVKQMVGINTVELFGAYLDIEIDKLKNNIDADIIKANSKDK